VELQKTRERLMHSSSKQPWKPILVKIAPDLMTGEVDQILAVCDERGVDGIIATNTTVSREGVADDPLSKEAGGLSGPPLFPKALAMVSYIHKMSPHLPIVGVGGISSADDAFQMLQEAGARLVQVGTGLVYEGPWLPRNINIGLIERLKERFSSVTYFTPEPPSRVVPKLHPQSVVK